MSGLKPGPTDKSSRIIAGDGGNKPLLNERETEYVCAGTFSQTADDSRFLNSLNGSTDRYDAFKIYCDVTGSRQDEIIGAWADLGVHCATCGGTNHYSVNGQSLTQDDARAYAMNVTNHIMERAEWDW